MARVLLATVFCLLCASLVRGYLDESALTDDLRTLIANLRKGCSAKTGVEIDLITKTHEGEFPADSKLKCYMQCILSEGGAMNVDGVIDYSAIEGILPDKLKGGIRNMFEKCAIDAKNADLCERAFEFYTCSYKVDPQAYFLV